jgi:hypothetical protein
MSANRISPDLLTDTLSLIQLARETALARGQQAQAERLNPVAENLQSLVGAARQPQPAAPTSNAGGVMGQSDFKALLAAAQTPAAAPSPSSAAERNQIISALSAGGMGEIDIARQLGLARDEVRLVLNLGQSRPFNPQVYK